MRIGLANDARVAVIGGGLAGAATAAALLFNARCRGRNLEVKVFEGASPGESFPAPIVLSAECRSRLAALGCRVAPEWRVAELRGIEIIRDGRAELLTVPAGVWVLDDWPHGSSGRDFTTRALSSVAALHGAQFVRRRVHHVETVAPFQRKRIGPGTLAVHSAGGSVECFHGAVLATGARNVLQDEFFPGFSGAPTLPAVEARLRLPFFRGPALPMARLVLWPLPRVEALYLIPAGHSVHAVAWGQHLEPADLCQALMIASRDGLLTQGFEISHLRLTKIPCGVGRRTFAPGRIAVGAAAMGQPFQLGVSQALAACSRASIALVDAGQDEKHLKRGYLRHGIKELIEDIHEGVKAAKWLRPAGSRALEVLRSTNLLAATGPVGGGLLGLPGPTPRAVRIAARRAALLQAFQPPPVARAKAPLETAGNLFYVVDDDADMRESLTELLEARGAEVVAFSNELALYCAVARRPPNAVILDVVLRWVDGLRLCEGLKSHPLTSATRVIVMSGLDRPHVRERALAAGAEAFLAKPVDPQQLWNLLTDPTGEPVTTPMAPLYVAEEEHASI